MLTRARLVLSWVIFLILPCVGWNQEFKDLQFLRDYAETRGFMLGRPTKAVPTPDGRFVLFLRAEARSPKLLLYEFDVEKGSTRLLLTPDDILKGTAEKLSPEEKAVRERMRISSRGFADFKISKNGNHVLLALSGKLYLWDRRSSTLQELKTGAGPLLDPQFSPDGRFVSYVRSQDVFIYEWHTDTETQVTTGGTELVSHGLAEFVAQEEMSRFSGYWWSQDSKSIAFQQTDVQEVEIWHVADPVKPDQPPFPSRYPRPGKANAKVSLGVVGITGGTPVWVKWDSEKFPYLGSVRWEKHGPLTISVQSRDQKLLQLLRVDARSGQVERLLQEEDSTWVSLRQDVPRWLPEDKGFLWASERDGFWKLEWRGITGDLKKVLTQESHGFASIADVFPSGEEIIFSGRTKSSQRQAFRLSLKDGKIREVAGGPGLHDVNFENQSAIFVHTATTIQSLASTTVHRVDGTVAGVLPSVAENPSWTPQVELVQVGDPSLAAAVVRPKDFQPGRSYPVILHVYGGPLPPGSSGMVTESMRSFLLPQWIANQGFFVVSVDGRGTASRGRAWERAIYKNFHRVPLEDQIRGLKALAKRFPELDLNRVGIYGWSFGGYLSALGVLKEPDFFKAAVAGAPPTDWLDYDTHYTERYLGFPDTDAQSYEDASLLPLAKQLRRPLLIVHGTDDDNVFFRHSLKLADALFRQGKDFELLPLSGFTHMVPDPLVNEKLYTRIVTHFKRHLKE